MPTVPTTFVPPVAPQAPGDVGQFQAPGVQPMENLAGPQVARFGQAMTATGNAAFRLGSAIQDGIDDATTKQADVMAVRGMQQVADRFLGTMGQQSEREFEAAMGQLSQAGAAAMDTLQNDTQRAMFSPILARNMAMYQSRMSQHRNGQVRVWNTNEAVARSEVNADNAIFAYQQKDEVDAEGRKVGMIRYTAYQQTAIAEARKAGELMGYAPDSAQMEQLEQKVNDRIATGVVQSLVSQGKFAEAQEFLDAQGTIDSLAPKAREALGNTVDVKRQGAVIGELTNSIRDTGVLNAKSDPKTYGQEAGEGAEPPTTLREALTIAENIKDDEVRKAVQAQLRVQYAQDDALITQEYRAVLANRDDWLAVPGNSAADFPQLDRLTPADRERTYAMQLQKDDDAVLADIDRNPALLLDEEFMNRASQKISPATMRILRERAAQPEKVAAATYDSDMLKRVLYDAGLDDVVDGDDTENKRKFITLSDNLKTAISVRQQQLGGRQLTPAEKREEIDRLVMQYGQAAPSKLFGVDWLWPDTKLDIPLAMMSQEQMAMEDESRRYFKYGNKEFTKQQVEDAEAYMRAGGITRPTIREVLMYLAMQGRGK